MPTRRGWAAFAAGVGLWIGSRYAGSPDLHMIAVGILALPFLAALYVQWNRVRLEVRRHLSSGRVHPGRRVVVTIELENRGPGTAPLLLLEDALPAELGRSARLVATGIPPRQRHRVSYSVVCRRRGRFLIGPLSTSVSDPFGLARVAVPTAPTSELIVYPEVEDVELSGLAVQGAGSGESAVRRLYRTADEFYTMREYVTGDDLRRIHWPSVARTHRLMIRQDETTRRSAATLFLDNRLSALGATGSPGFEKAVSAAATIGRELIRTGFALRLASVDAPAVPVTEDLLLEALAGASSTRVRGLGDAVRALRTSSVADSTLVMVTEPPSPREVAAISRLGPAFGRRIGVFVHPVDLSTLPGEAAEEVATRASSARASLLRAGWRVYVLEPGGRLADVWKRTPRLRRVASSS